MSKSDASKKIYFKKYKIKKLISKSSCCRVYEGININNNEPVALKFEKRQGQYKLLESEAFFLINLKGFGIPKIITYGKVVGYNLLVEELLGKSIQSIWKFNRKINEKLKDLCMFSIQGIDRLEYTHSKYIIHRDIKPQNFVIGRKDPNIIYLIDFGFSRKYRSSRTGKHIQYKFTKKFIGSLKYISSNGNKGYELSRRDDLESFGYMIIELLTNNLPWVNINKLPRNEKIIEISKIKNNTTPEKLCKGLPEEFLEYIKYVKQLEFEQNPDYNYLKGLFISVLSRNELKNDLCFSWIINKKKVLGLVKNEQNYEEKSQFLTKRRQNSHKILYNKIKNSLKKISKSEINISINSPPKINLDLRNINSDSQNKEKYENRNHNSIKKNKEKKIILNILYHPNNKNDYNLFKYKSKIINEKYFLLNNLNMNSNRGYILNNNKEINFKKNYSFATNNKKQLVTEINPNDLKKMINNNSTNRICSVKNNAQLKKKILITKKVTNNYNYKTLYEREQLKRIKISKNIPKTNNSENKSRNISPIFIINGNNNQFNNTIYNSYFIKNKTLKNSPTNKLNMNKNNLKRIIKNSDKLSNNLNNKNIINRNNNIEYNDTDDIRFYNI